MGRVDPRPRRPTPNGPARTPETSGTLETTPSPRPPPDPPTRLQSQTDRRRSRRGCRTSPCARGTTRAREDACRSAGSRGSRVPMSLSLNPRWDMSGGFMGSPRDVGVETGNEAPIHAGPGPRHRPQVSPTGYARSVGPEGSQHPPSSSDHPQDGVTSPPEDRTGTFGPDSGTDTPGSRTRANPYTPRTRTRRGPVNTVLAGVRASGDPSVTVGTYLLPRGLRRQGRGRVDGDLTSTLTLRVGGWGHF